MVEQALAGEAETLSALWAERDGDEDAPRLTAGLQAVIDRLLRAALRQLYPQSPVPEPELAEAGHSA